MPKKLSSAVVGTLAVGLTLPAAVAAANEAEAASPNDLPQPLSGAGEAAPAPSLASGVSISTGSSAGTFADPLADQSYTFSTGKGPRCISVQGAFANHQGQDLVTEEGTPIGAISDGTVVRTVDGSASRPGFIVLRHNIGGQVYHSGYLHVWDAESHVSVGDTVSAGDPVGLVGDSGPTVTAHLHLEIWQGGWHTGTALDPAQWLAERGVDLQAGAQRVQQPDTASSCDYFTTEAAPLLKSANGSSEVLAQLPRAAELVSAPGDAQAGFVRVTANGETGWVQHGHLTPDRPAGTSEGAAEPAGSSGSAGQHRVTEPLYARSGPGTDHDIRQGMPTGELITVTATSGDWVQFTRRGEQVWSHGAYLESAGASEGPPEASTSEEADTPAPQTGSGSAAEEPAEAGSATGTHQVTTPLNVRSGAGLSHGIVGGMPAAERVSVLSAEGDWRQIRRANGQQGWVHSAYLSGGSSPGTPETDSDSPDTDASEREQQAGEPEAEDSSNTEDSTNTEADEASAAEQSGSSADSGAADEDPSTSASATHTVDGVHLNARSGAGTDHPTVTVLRPGTGVEVTGRSGAWASFDRDGSTLWVHTDHLRGISAESTSADDSAESSGSSESSSAQSSSSSGPVDSSATSGATEPSTSAPDSDSDAVSTTEWVNLRSGASTDHSVQRTVAPNTDLEVLDRSGGWYKVSTGSSTGWIWQDYLNLPESAASSSEADTSDPTSSGSSSEVDSQEDDSGSSSASDSSSPSSSSSGSAESGSSSGSSSSSASEESSQSSSSSAQVTSGVNMRSGAGMSHGVLQTVSGGTDVDVLDEQGGWYQVRTAGRTGWIWRDFLDVPGTASPSGSASSGSSSSGSSSSESSSGSSGSSAASSGSGASESDSSGSSSSGSGSSSGRTGPSSGQHAQSSHGPYSAVWDRLAQCESGGNWSINTGNGFYGGVQFSQQSWQWVGGSGLPSAASKQEQIERAYALWQRQGWNAWPACSAQLGLSGDPGGWGDSYFDVHGGTQSASAFATAGQWTAGYSVPLREAPSADSDKLAQVPRGAVLDAGERRGSWLQVEFTQDGESLTGWVSTRFIMAA